MSVYAKIACPVCGRTHSIPYPTNETECVCHTVCPDGQEPRDCTVSEYNYSGQLGYPAGVHGSDTDYGADRIHAAGYCSTHKRYVYRQKVIIEVNWGEYLKTRVEPGSRLSAAKK